MNCDKSALINVKSPREFAAFGQVSQAYYLFPDTYSFLNFDIWICRQFLKPPNNVVDLLPDPWKVVIVPALRGLRSPEGEHLCCSMNAYRNGLGT